jgi:hypothetical protein
MKSSVVRRSIAPVLGTSPFWPNTFMGANNILAPGDRYRIQSCVHVNQTPNRPRINRIVNRTRLRREESQFLSARFENEASNALVPLWVGVNTHFETSYDRFVRLER